MSHIRVGYGEYQGYLLTELPITELNAIAARYPLQAPDGGAEYDDLLITVAVHAEIQRREAGGKPATRRPSVRQLAQEIVNWGFQQASKRHHPDNKGDHETQVRLTQTRDKLLGMCDELPNDTDNDGTTYIPASAPPPGPPRQPTAWGGISDNDVPF